MEFVRVASLAEIPAGEVRAFELPSGRVAVAHVDHRVFAVSDGCTHAGCPVSEGAVSADEVSVRCSCNDCVFDLENGEPLDGSATDPLPVYPVRLDDGWVEVGTEPGVQP
jgi:3-phenylpropionate/trans-cinnamate dioxygenase ferredoxin subunit